jgi:hypothetical protein
MGKPQLIFAYNSDKGLFGSLTDFAHKIISPATYQCQLCALTHGNFSMKSEWKSFMEMLPVKALFLYKNEFLKKYEISTSFPAVFIEKNGMLKTFLSTENIEQFKTLQELIDAISFKLSKYDGNF